MSVFQLVTIVFFFNDTATTEIYSLSLHDALPISRVLARPGEAARLQPPGAQPHARAVVDQHLEPVGAAVGKHVGVVGLRAQREAAHHLGQQRVDAPAQVGRAKRQPDDVDANHRPNSRSSEASSRVCASGQCRSSRVPPTFNSTRTDVDAAPGATRAATKPLGLAAGEGSGLTPRSEEHTSELQSPCNLVCRLLL